MIVYTNVHLNHFLENYFKVKSGIQGSLQEIAMHEVLLREFISTAAVYEYMSQDIISRGRQFIFTSFTLT